MKKLLLLLMLAPFIHLSAQTDKQNMAVVTNADPVFPTGDKALYMYMMENIRYSDEAKKSYVEGEVTLSFDVMPDSTVSNVVVISGVGKGVDEEVKRIVSGLKFSPGRQNGMAIRMNTMYTFPVKAH